MGHSMGGKVAMAFNYLFPEISKNLIILDVSPKAYNENNSNVIEHKKILKSLNEIDLSKFNDRLAIYKELVIKLKSETLARFMLKNITRKNNCFAWKINVNSLLNNIDSIMGEALPINTKTDIACLFIKAEKSDYLKESDYKVINSIYRRNSIRIIKNTSHWLHIENPNGLLKEIKEFINKK
jgi:esterase